MQSAAGLKLHILFHRNGGMDQTERGFTLEVALDGDLKRLAKRSYRLPDASPKMLENYSQVRVDAEAAEQQRKRELEEGFNNFTDNRRERVRTIADLADEYLAAYKLRHPQSAVFAEYAVNHVSRVLGSRMFVDCNKQHSLCTRTIVSKKTRPQKVSMRRSDPCFA